MSNAKAMFNPPTGTSFLHARLDGEGGSSAELTYSVQPKSRHQLRALGRVSRSHPEAVAGG